MEACVLSIEKHKTEIENLKEIMVIFCLSKTK